MTTTFGDVNVAKQIYNHTFGQNTWPPPRAPKGFKRVGSGAYRDAYLHKPSGLVYKVGDYDSNVSESYVSRKLRRKSTRGLGFELYVPRTRTYRMPSYAWNDGDAPEPMCVVVQEFAASARHTTCELFDGWRENRKCSCRQTPCFADILTTIEQWSEVEDIHGGNVLVDKNKTYWLIDMGS